MAISTGTFGGMKGMKPKGGSKTKGKTVNVSKKKRKK